METTSPLSLLSPIVGDDGDDEDGHDIQLHPSAVQQHESNERIKYVFFVVFPFCFFKTFMIEWYSPEIKTRMHEQHCCCPLYAYQRTTADRPWLFRGEIKSFKSFNNRIAPRKELQIEIMSIPSTIPNLLMSILKRFRFRFVSCVFPTCKHHFNLNVAGESKHTTHFVRWQWALVGKR